MPAWADEVFTRKTDVTSLDISTMAAMSDDEYRDYVRQGLFFVDHNWVLRSEPAGYSLACTRRQLDILVEELQELRAELNQGS